MFIYLMMIETPEDESKFEMLYKTYQGLMYYVAYEILENKEDSEDAVHQAFVKIAENISSIDTSVSQKTKALVALIAERQAIDLLRRREKREYVPLDEWEGIGIAYDGDNALTTCMTNLPETYRTILLLKYCYGYSSKETAKILGLTESNVIKLHYRAKKRLEYLCKEADLL